jgi:hypothetical protein
VDRIKLGLEHTATARHERYAGRRSARGLLKKTQRMGLHHAHRSALMRAVLRG